MPLVVDVSVMMSWHFEDEHSPAADALRTQMQDVELLVPAHWWFEIRNALLMGERRGRSRQSATEAFLDRLGAFSISVVATPDDSPVFALARRHRLTFYDAAYLELAKREDCALATFDEELIAAARAERIPLA